MRTNNIKKYDGLPVGRRIHVIGNSCAGKSTLGAQLADSLEVPFVELDALNWEPGWVGLNDTNPEEFERRTPQYAGIQYRITLEPYTIHSA